LFEYYVGRIWQRGFWEKLLAGQLSLKRSLLGVADTVLQSIKKAPGNASRATQQYETLPVRVCRKLADFAGLVLIILSENDLTATEFRQHARSRSWRRVLACPSIVQREISEADHTFSRREWRDQVSNICGQWLQSW
jgi:hypothetical protein